MWYVDSWVAVGAGGGGGPPTAAEITTALQGAAADATRIGTEYLPVTMEVDYLEVADSAGTPLPSNVFGRIGNTPYFGSSPLSNGVEASFALGKISNGSPSRTLLASLPLTATQLAAVEIFLSFQLIIDHSSSADEWAVHFDFDGGTDTTTGIELLIRATGPSNYQFLGHVNTYLTDSDTLFGLTTGLFSPIYNSTAGFAVAVGYDDWNDTNIGGGGGESGTAAVGLPNNLNIYLLDKSAENAESIVITGYAKIVE